ncbi:CshA/CshB family fibrillar adhesin-related protein [Demequina sp. NBRC 110051]|uniref:CshA/CshB family fibrillar adhesin-related protein n=1 Tax=Demequina sp. NBRC 110051 TaxID=1570340 RepID=UPI00117C5649|nr:CshA/CshB family fibrillar adhesin-related protein [Demequina sp. NBRC 110051]
MRRAPHRHRSGEVLRRRGIPSLIVLAALLLGIVVVSPPAEARYAEGGEGLYPGYIDWFEWGDDGTPIAEGTTVTNRRTVGANVLATTCTISGIGGDPGGIEAYRPGNYRGDALDNLYNIGGIDGANELVSGIANVTGTGRAVVNFDFDCEVTLSGLGADPVPVDVAGLVFADAESNNESQGEYIEATPDQPDATWRVIDRIRGCDTSTMATREGLTLRLDSNGQQCAEANNTYGPIAVGFMEGATGASVEMQGGGVSAVALGVVFEADFGDAPIRYLGAGALLQSVWNGGEVPEGETNVSDESFVLGAPGGYEPILGSTVDSDGGYVGSANADLDDTTGNPATDEDGIEPPDVVDTDYGETFSLTPSCVGTGEVAGWIDWNDNGTFDDSERQGPVTCSDGTVTLTWTVPDDAVQTVVDPTFLRLRIADTAEGASSPNGLTSRGEVEDYPIYVDLPDPGLTIAKEADPADEVLPGGLVEYTITVENTGEVPYDDEHVLASFTDDLSDVLDDATYVPEAQADIGIVSLEGDVLSWSGPLGLGEIATITYTVQVDDPFEGNGSLNNTVVGPAESNCAEDSADPSCTAVVPIKDLVITKSVDPAGEALAGGVVEYTITVTNTGQAPYTADDPATLTDDLTDVLDDATYNDDVAADPGTATVTDTTLSWEGELAPGASAEITYSVTVLDPAESGGDGFLDNAVVGPDESNCAAGSTDPDCETSVPVRALQIIKTSDGSDGPRPGDTVTYTISVTNTGQVPYTDDDPASFDDDLTEVLDDAEPGTVDAPVGTASFDSPILHWEGPLGVGETVDITYTVVIDDPLEGDGSLFNVVVGPSESNCTDPDETNNADCIEPNPIRALEITKTSEPADEVLAGDTITYTVTVENTGTYDYTDLDPASFTDDLSDVLDDAEWDDNVTVTAGTTELVDVDFSWEGPVEAGDTVTVTYSVTVTNPLSGDGYIDNAVVGPPESNCDAGALSPDPDCSTSVPVRALDITKEVDPADQALRGDQVTYTVTIENVGEVAYTADDPAVVTDDLSEVLDDATWDGNITVSGGNAEFVSPELTWTGPIAVDETVTITYTVTVDDPDLGDGVLANVVVGPSESNCSEDSTDPDCATEVPVGAVDIVKTASPADEVLPGETVTYTVTIDNVGQVAYTDVTVTDDLSEVLDDAEWDGNLTASSGSASFLDGILTWEGDLAIGASVTVQYSVTVYDPLQGDGLLDNAVVGPSESNCAEGSTDPDCVTEVPVRALNILKVADPAGEVLPGESVTFTVTVENIGQVDYTADAPAEVVDDLTAVLDDAEWDGEVTVSAGEWEFTSPELSWSGPVAVGETVTITYSVTVNDPLTGNGLLDNVVTGPVESNCEAESTDPDCATEVPVKALEIVKAADPDDEVLPGETVTYTVTIENIGQVDYTDLTVSDDLTDVLDDALWVGNITVTAGAAEYVRPTLTWTGPVAVDETVTITYDVTVNDPRTGDGLLTNAVLGPPESNCEADSIDPDCSTEVPVRSLQLEKTSNSDGSVQPGERVEYQITVTNTGEVDYTADNPASITDDLAALLDDAEYNNDASAPVGTIDYTGTVLTWEGPLAVDESVTITYSVTVNDPLSGDGVLDNVVVGPPESNCDSAETTDPDCVEPNPIRALKISKQASPSDEVLPGGTVTYTVTIENTGVVDYTDDDPAVVSDDLTEVLDDALWGGSVFASAGTADYDEPILTWTGPIEAGDTVTVQYSVTVYDPLQGDGLLDNAVVGPSESNCAEGSTDPDCVTEVPVRALNILKVADPAGEVLPGESVTFTVTVENIGQVDYTADAPAEVVDDLTAVLDDAEWDGEVTVSAGEWEFTSPELSWSGPVAVGETVTITYSVTVNDPLTGNGLLDNVVTGPVESNCEAESTDPDCATEVPVKALEIVKTADPDDEVLPGETVTYTVTIENIGQVDYTRASVTDDMSSILDDATYDGDATASAGGFTFSRPVLNWTGPVAVGDTVTITYSVVVNDPLTGDGILTNVVLGPPESNCEADSEDEACTTEVPVRALELVKTSDTGIRVQPGDSIEYTITVTNIGQVAYTEEDPAVITDDLSGVLDDATYQGDAQASDGDVSVIGLELTWTGPLAVGGDVTITYTVVVNEPVTGDGSIANVVQGPPESNCTSAVSLDPDCIEFHTLRALDVLKTADPEGSVTVGDTVTYTVEVTNSGFLPYTFLNPAEIEDDLTDVLDDATYNDDAAASTGEVAYAEPLVTWSGALGIGETATITYSVTVDDPPGGDIILDNAVLGPPESNCFAATPRASAGDVTWPEGCHVETPIRILEVGKTVDVDAASPGDVVTYTVTVESTGTAPFTDDQPATFTDDLTEVLDDAKYNDDAMADAGEVSFDEPMLSWSGPLAVDGVVTVTYSVTVDDPPGRDMVLLNSVVGPPGSQCAVPTADEPLLFAAAAQALDCETITPIRMYEVAKAVDVTEAAPGDVVTYAVTVTSTGTADYTDDVPATFVDDLTEVLDDASYNDDADASTGTATFDAPNLTWSGPLAAGESVTVTYSVTVDDPVEGDLTMDNVVAPDGEIGGTCVAEGECETSTPIEVPPVVPVDPEQPVTPGGGGSGGVLGTSGPDAWIPWAGLAALLTILGAAVVGLGRRREA